MTVTSVAMPARRTIESFLIFIVISFTVASCEMPSEADPFPNGFLFYATHIVRAAACGIRNQNLLMRAV
jgi:hypothetical protein